MEDTEKPTSKIITFNKPVKPGEPDPFDKVDAGDAPVAITPFVLTDHKAIPPRDWCYDKYYIRDFVSATVGSGGTGKSSLILSEELAMATGRDLLGVKPRRRLKVWTWNGEDPYVELQRRVAAACLYYGITQDELYGQFFLDSGRDNALVIATQTRDGITIQEPVIDALVEKIREEGIDVAVIDPFVSCHRVTENDNNAIALVVEKWGYVADKGHCSIMLAHHVRKTQPGAELTMEDTRGASALLAGVRVGRALNQMPSGFGSKHGISNHRAYMRINHASEKANMSEPRVGDDWYRFVSVDLQNGVPFPVDEGGFMPGDKVGVIEKWTPPDPMAGVDAAAAARAQATVGSNHFRLDVRAKGWVGIPIAEALGVDIGLDANGRLKPLKEIRPVQAMARLTVKAALDDWLKEDWFKVIEDASDQRKPKAFVAVGKTVPLENVEEFYPF